MGFIRLKSWRKSEPHLPTALAADEEMPARLSTARVDLAAAQVMPAWIDEIAGLRSELGEAAQNGRRSGN